jgi:hypothetical protein
MKDEYDFSKAERGKFYRPERGVFVLNPSQAAAAIEKYEAGGWRLFVLPDGMSSKEQFIRGMQMALPLDPPICPINWDAVSDSIWGGLEFLAEAKILIVWPNSSLMRASVPGDADIAVDILAALPGDFADPVPTAGSVKEIAVILIDENNR